MNRLTNPRTQTLRGSGGRLAIGRQCEERSDEAIQHFAPGGLLRYARNDVCNQQYCAPPNICYAATMIGGSTPEALAARFTAVVHAWVAEGPAERTDRARRKLLSTIASNEPATLNHVAKSLARGAPAVSRSVDALVRAGFVERTQ